MGACLKKCLSLFPYFSTHRIEGKKIREIKQLAEGGYGYVSLVQDVETKKRYAMKKMICQTTEQKQMYRHEVAILKELAHCPHIIGYFGSHAIDRGGHLQTYILMELGERTIFDVLLENERKGACMSEMQILKVLRDVALALKEMHEQGIMHNDVKVENILIFQSGVAKLCDFGSCTRHKIDLATASKSQIYKYEQQFEKNTTLMYRPPQMVDIYLKYPVNEKVDIWMLGCVLYVMNYLHHPFQDEGKLSIVNAVVRYPDTVTEKMENLMRNMLTPNPYFRPSLDQIIAHIDNWKGVDPIALNAVAKIIKNHDKSIETESFDHMNQQSIHKMRPFDNIP